MSYLCIAFFKISSNKKTVFRFDGYHVEKINEKLFQSGKKICLFGV